MSLAPQLRSAYLFDDEALIPATDQPPYSALRLPDGRAFAWAEYGSPRGLPALLLPDTGSSRLSPGWLLHDSALPSSIRLLAVDRPGTGASDPIRLGGDDDPAEDLRRMIDTLAVGRVALIGIGKGVDDALALAARYPSMVTCVMAVSARLSAGASETRGLPNPFSRRHGRAWLGTLSAWVQAAGRGADLSEESVWVKARGRMEPTASSILGDRWLEADFRAAVAADVALSAGEWTRAARPEEPRWVREWDSSTVPVHFWHGREESSTHVSSLRNVCEGRPSWSVTAVPGCGALLGSWEPILKSVEQSYTRGIAQQRFHD